MLIKSDECSPDWPHFFLQRCHPGREGTTSCHFALGQGHNHAVIPFLNILCVYINIYIYNPASVPHSLKPDLFSWFKKRERETMFLGLFRLNFPYAILAESSL